MSESASVIVPRAVMLATVRNRSGVVAAVEPFDGDNGRLHLVHIEYKDSGAPSEERLLWELEPGRRLLEPTALPDPTSADAMPPEVLASRIVDRIDPYHSFLVNRNKQGSMLLPGDTLFIFEMTPSANALLAANEAEKAADVKLVDCRFMGAAGRLYMAGTASDVRTAADAARSALGAAPGAGAA